MKIRKFAAPSVPQALRQVRDELGEDAVILNTRQVAGEGGGQQIEITAALDGDFAPEPVAAPVAAAVAERSPRGDLLGRTYGRSAPGGDEFSAPAPRWERDQMPSGPGAGASRRGAGRSSAEATAWLASLPKVPKDRMTSPASRIASALAADQAHKDQAHKDQAHKDQAHKEQADRPSATTDRLRGDEGFTSSSAWQDAAPEETESASTSSGAPVLRRLRQIEDAVRHMARHSSSFELPGEVARLGERLRRVGLSEDLTRSLLPKILRQVEEADQDNREHVNQAAASILYEMLPERMDLRIGRQRKVIAFVGPSGSGKTTAIAKIAAGFVRRRQRREDYVEGEIAIISTDTQRVGALAQARAYADLIGVPLEDAHDAADLERALARHAKARLVLIDTAGIGPHGVKQREQLRRLLETAHVDEVQVVLDGRTGHDHMLDILEVCDGEQPRRLLLSKMDEAMHPGAALSAAITGAMPSSYFTTGPTIPGGIAPGDLQQLVDWVVGRCPSPFAPSSDSQADVAAG